MLELGLSFSPSTKSINKEEITADVFQFICKLKLREYFDSNSDDNSQMEVPENDEVDPSKWKQRNPSWYPDKVRKGRSEGLNRWINSILNSINGELTCNQGKLFNNLTVEQRNALNVLSNDKNIVIKPADKGGALVIMDKEDYEKACNAVLEDPEFYEELKEDPNPGYQEKVKQAADEL